MAFVQARSFGSEESTSIRSNNHGRGYGRHRDHPRIYNTIPVSQRNKQQSKDKHGRGRGRRQIFYQWWNVEVELTQNIYLQLLEEEENEINELVYDFTDLMIVQEIEAYRETNNMY
ncbi:26033_t:CDS:2, partial [Dentiscutata erythropus]